MQMHPVKPLQQHERDGSTHATMFVAAAQRFSSSLGAQLDRVEAAGCAVNGQQAARQRLPHPRQQLDGLQRLWRERWWRQCCKISWTQTRQRHRGSLQIPIQALSKLSSKTVALRAHPPNVPAQPALRAHLQRADDPRHHAQHAGIHAARTVARRRRLGEQAAVAGACGLAARVRGGLDNVLADAHGWPVPGCVPSALSSAIGAKAGRHTQTPQRKSSRSPSSPWQ